MSSMVTILSDWVETINISLDISFPKNNEMQI